MRIQKTQQKCTGYILWLSAWDTYTWAHRSQAKWPCSRLSNHRAVISVDADGLYDLTIDGQDKRGVDSDELVACVSDHLPKDLRHLWPVWEK